MWQEVLSVIVGKLWRKNIKKAKLVELFFNKYVIR